MNVPETKFLNLYIRNRNPLVVKELKNMNKTRLVSKCEILSILAVLEAIKVLLSQVLWVSQSLDEFDWELFNHKIKNWRLHD